MTLYVVLSTDGTKVRPAKSKNGWCTISNTNNQDNTFSNIHFRVSCNSNLQIFKKFKR